MPKELRMRVLRSSLVKTVTAALAACSLLMSVPAAAQDQTPQRPSWYARERVTDLTLQDPAYRNSAAYQALRKRYQSKLAEAQAHPEKAGAIASDLWSEISDYPRYTGTSAGQEKAKLGLEMFAEIVAIWERRHPQQNTRDGSRFFQGGPPASVNSDPGTRTPPPSAGGNQQNSQSTITGGKPLDPYALGAVHEITRDAKSGDVVDVSKLMREQPSSAERAETDRDSKITAKYDKITAEMARETVAKYGSIPGGVLLEGESGELAPAQSVRYLAKANVFVLDDTIVYPNPVQEDEFSEIYRAIQQDNRLGVSLLPDEKRILFGKLPPAGRLALNLLMVDGFLGSIASGTKRFTAGYAHAPGYDATEGDGATSFYLKVLGYQFAKNNIGVMVRTNTKIQTTLVPISQARAKDGGSLPDFARIRSGDIAASHVGRIQHLSENFNYYARERILRLALAYGEAAAFVRILKAKGIRVAGL